MKKFAIAVLAVFLFTGISFGAVTVQLAPTWEGGVPVAVTITESIDGGPLESVPVTVPADSEEFPVQDWR